MTDKKTHRFRKTKVEGGWKEKEFWEWVSFHNGLYAGFFDWMEKNTQAQFEWKNAIEEFSVSEVKQASRIHFKRPNGSKAEGYSRSLADLLEILRSQRRGQEAYEPTAGRYAHRCGLCQNSGLVSCQAREGFTFRTGGFKIEIERASVACKCEAGDRFRMRFWTYDEASMIPVSQLCTGEELREKNRRNIEKARLNREHAWANAAEVVSSGKASPRILAGTVAELQSQRARRSIEAGPEETHEDFFQPDWSDAPPADDDKPPF